ncbi:MAG: hypothetical protein ACXWZF_06690 [Actinomycetota bacterium]
MHPIALASPETYERYLELVRVIVDELEVVDTRAQLLEADRNAEAIARRAVAGSGLVSEGLDLRLAAGAAFAVRSRRLAVEERRNDAEHRVRAARERGDAWVVIEETGDGVLTPYRRLEMHVPDGAGLICTVEADLEGGPTVYRAQVVELDPRTGRGVDRPEGIGEPLTFSERRPWQDAIVNLMSRIESSS